MNRARAGGPSKASATTLCQKCLKRGHYSYECTASQQDRPYVSRPSRTQQLLNPKLAPKIKDVAPPKDDSSTKAPGGQKRTRAAEPGSPRKRSRSASVSSYSSEYSVSSISTNRSGSSARSPPRQERRRRYSNDSRDERSYPAAADGRKFRSRRGSSVRGDRIDGRSEDDGAPSRPRRQFDSRSRSPDERRSRDHARRSRSRSPHRPRRGEIPPQQADGARSQGRSGAAETTSLRPRSLSPYSKRLALSQTGR